MVYVLLGDINCFNFPPKRAFRNLVFDILSYTGIAPHARGLGAIKRNKILFGACKLPQS